MRNTGIEKILRSNNTVFSFKDITLLWGETDRDNVKAKINYYVKAGKLHPIRRGFYAKSKDYNKLELATKIYKPSYISFETVLRKEGVIFQHYDTIFAASYLDRDIVADGQPYTYRKLKDIIVANPAGVIKKEGYMEASKERAFMDMLYLDNDYHFDNLHSMNWSVCLGLQAVYSNHSLGIKLNEYYNNARRS